ncbi:ATP-binding protein [Croceicoccus sp. Ery5]|uniref:ATP-binding response regulator n=1 Tax=Croceicoccus sp. Ery5 TaxID=1703340 RepID=UPI001E6577BA|nr:ATP-binding protein [Croceicoccus sp. Ery5]
MESVLSRLTTGRAAPRHDTGLLERIATLESRQAELLRAKAAAEAANEAKTRFLASVSHEIRSPLNSIYGYAQLLERGTARDPAHAARVIRRSSEHLANLVEGLLDLSQVEGGVMRISRDTIRFPALIRQIVDMFEPQARARGIDFHFECPAPLPEFVRGDQKRLRQVLINLLSNAIKFTDSGRVTLKITYRSQIATFEVADSGIGIPAERLDRIFEAFERSNDSANDRPGTGLGLAITQALVRIMGGEIAVESRVGEGTRFTVRLMLSEPAERPADETPTTAVTGYRGPRRTILVVDDDAAQSALLSGLLEPLGFAVSAASDADGAVRLAADMLPDLVFLDISMPGKSGWEAARMLRARYGSALRIVMLSADADEFRGAGDAAGPHDAFVLKPFEFGALLDVVSAQLQIEWTGNAVQKALSDASVKATPAEDLRADPRMGPHLAAIAQAARIGDIRGIEDGIDALAALASGDDALVARLRRCLDGFDLKALASLAEKADAEKGNSDAG